MNYRNLLLLFVLCSFISFLSGCKENVTGSNAPRAAPQSHVLDNLELIGSLEHLKHPTSLLTRAAGDSTRDGIVVADGVWDYVYTDFEHNNKEYTWEVWPDGNITHDDNGFTPPISLIPFKFNFEPLLKVNSDEAVTIAIENGGSALLKKYPDAYISVLYEFLYPGSASCDVTITDRTFQCSLSFRLDAQTGVILKKKTSCPQEVSSAGTRFMMSDR